MYEHALDALNEALGVSRGLSEDYRRAVEGHTPWTPSTPDPEPILRLRFALEAASVTRRMSLATSAGFSAYCVKPLDTAAFIRTVDRILLTGGDERSGVLWCQ